MKSQELAKVALPDCSGVYFFKKRGEILYVGKATSLRSRVRSYFAPDLIAKRSPVIANMVEEADAIDFQKTDSVLEALILEASLIKKYRPKANTLEKDGKSWNYVVITKEKFPRVTLIRGKELFDMIQKGDARVGGAKIASDFGPFPHGAALQEALKIVRRIFPFRDMKCVPKEEQKNSAGRPCFNRQIGLCPGVCMGEISAEDYAKQVRNIKLFFEGKKKELVRSLEREMKSVAKEQKFEQAAELRGKIYSLGHIHDVSLLKREHTEAAAGVRIEAYDIAHMSGKSTVGVMTVIEDGEAKKAEYRMFKVRGDWNGSDTDALKEVLSRRLAHSEWSFPNIIAIDGGQNQLNAAKEILELNSGAKGIILVSVVKDDSHKADHLLGDEAVILKHKDDIVLANSEAHRFAIEYHKKVRSKLLFTGVKRRK